MPEITRRISLSANQTVSNILGDTRLETVPKRGRGYEVSIYATASTADVEHDAFADSDNFIERGVVSAQNRVPLKDRDRVATVRVTPGTKLQINAIETGGAAATYFLTVTADPI
jgi:hypothetical protein